MKKFNETTSSQKTSCQSDSLFSGYWWFQVLIIPKCMHGLQACLLNTLLLLHSTFMLSVVKMSLKGEVGGHALDSPRNYIVDHEKIMEFCF